MAHYKLGFDPIQPQGSHYKLDFDPTASQWLANPKDYTQSEGITKPVTTSTMGNPSLDMLVKNAMGYGLPKPDTRQDSMTTGAPRKRNGELTATKDESLLPVYPEDNLGDYILKSAVNIPASMSHAAVDFVNNPIDTVSSVGKGIKQFPLDIVGAVARLTGNEKAAEEMTRGDVDAPRSPDAYGLGYFLPTAPIAGVEGNLVKRVLAGAGTFGVADALTQYAKNGEISLKSVVANSILGGAMSGALGHNKVKIDRLNTPLSGMTPDEIATAKNLATTPEDISKADSINKSIFKEDLAVPTESANPLATGNTKIDKAVETLLAKPTKLANELMTHRDPYEADKTQWTQDNPIQVEHNPEIVGTVEDYKNGLYHPAYHGTPHEVHTFSIDKIGTGEGAQAYGHGLYFAGGKEVGEYYRKKLSESVFDKDIEAHFKDNNYPYNEVITEAYRDAQAGKSKSEILGYIRNSMEHLSEFQSKTKYEDALKIINKIAESPSKGNLYKVELKPEEHEYLNWDKPLSEQSDFVKKIIKDKIQTWAYPEKGIVGAALHNRIRDLLGGDKAAADYLHDVGIRGIKYLDGSSRSAGKGAHNFVIFNDKDIQITGANGKMHNGDSDALFSLQRKQDFTTSGEIKDIKEYPSNNGKVYKLTESGRLYNKGGFLNNPDVIKKIFEPEVLAEIKKDSRSLKTAKTKAENKSYREFMKTDLDRAVEIATKQFGEPFRISKHLGKPSSYYFDTPAGVIRVSNHDLPYNHDMAMEGRNRGEGFVNDFIFEGKVEPEELLRFNEWVGKGTFDEGNPNILHQTQDTQKQIINGLYEKLGANHIIRTFKGADMVTVFHEYGHAIRAGLTDGERAYAEKIFGVENGKWERSHEEEFAHAFVKYLGTGEAPTTLMAKLFAKIQKGIQAILQAHPEQLEALHNLTPEQASFFQAIFGDKKAQRELFEKGNEHAQTVLDLAKADRPKGESMADKIRAVKEQYAGKIGHEYNEDEYNQAMVNAQAKVNHGDVFEPSLTQGGARRIERGRPTEKDLENFKQDKKDYAEWNDRQNNKDIPEYERANSDTYIGDDGVLYDSQTGTALFQKGEADTNAKRLYDALPPVNTKRVGNTTQMSMFGAEDGIKSQGKLFADTTQVDTLKVPKDIKATPQEYRQTLGEMARGESVTDTMVAQQIARSKGYRESVEKPTQGALFQEGTTAAKIEKKYSIVDKMLKSDTAIEARRNFEDNFIDLKNLERMDGVKTKDGADPYQAQILYHGKLGHQIEIAKDTVSNIDKSIVELEKKYQGENILDAINGYLIAKHAPERNAEKGTKAAGISSDMAREMARGVENRPYFHEMKPIIDKIMELNKSTLDILKDGGLVSTELVTKLRERYPNHVPLQRIMPDELDVKQGIGGKGYFTRETGLKNAMGSEREVNDVMGNILTNVEQAIRRVEKNRVAQNLEQFIRLNKEHEYISDMFTIEKDKIIGYRTEIEEPNLFNEGKAVETKGAPIYEKVPPNAIVVFNKGEKTHLVIKNKEIAEAFQGLDVEHLNTVLKYAGVFTRFIAGMATRFNPEFMASNFIRDMQEALMFASSNKDLKTSDMFNPKRAMKAVYDYQRGIDNENSRLYKQMLEDGGTTGGMGLSTREAVGIEVDTLRRDNRAVIELKRKLTPEAIKNASWSQLKNLAKGIDSANEIVENSTRFSVYRSALENGATRGEAAVLAKESTVNFNKFGKYGRNLNALYMFSNASVQGSAKMVRALKDPKTLIATTAIMGALTTMLNGVNDSQDEDWRDKISDFEKNSNFIILTGSEEGKIKYLTIPIAWGIKPFKVVADRFYEVAFTNKTTKRKALLDMFASVWDGYNPLGGQDLAQTVVPTVLDPIVDIARNKSWMGNKIHPAHTADFLPSSENHFKNTDATIAGKVGLGVANSAAYLSNGAVQMSPDDIKYGIETVTGGASKFAGRVAMTGYDAAHSLAENVGIVSPSETPDKDFMVRNFPFANRFYKSLNADDISRNTKKNSLQDIKDAFEITSDPQERAQIVREQLQGKTYEQRQSVYRQMRDAGVSFKVKPQD